MVGLGFAIILSDTVIYSFPLPFLGFASSLSGIITYSFPLPLVASGGGNPWFPFFRFQMSPIMTSVTRVQNVSFLYTLDVKLLKLLSSNLSYLSKFSPFPFLLYQATTPLTKLSCSNNALII